MTTFQKSKLLWIGGGVVGGLLGYLSARNRPEAGRSTGMSTVLGAALGSIVVGAVGDKALEQEQRTGVFSLLPLGR